MREGEDCCGVQGGGGGCGGALRCPLSLSVVVLLLLSGISSVGGEPAATGRACQDGRGPQSAGWSGSGIEEGWRSQSTSWHQYFLFDVSCIQVRKEPYRSIWMVGTSWKRRHRFSTMKFFPVVCGRPSWHLWSQHAVIMLQDRQSGRPLIISQQNPFAKLQSSF
jgi:hypothetical protein